MDWSVIPITLINCERRIISGGYVTSNISESANSMMKYYVSIQTVDLISLHKAVDKLYEQRETNQSYIKKRKKLKMYDSSLYDIMLI